MGKSYIYKADAAEFTVKGASYDVSAVDMTLMPNALPMIKVSVSVDRSESGSVIHSLSLKSLASSLNDLVKLAGEKETASLSLTLTKYDASTGASVGTQSLNVSGWTLIGAGLNGVTTTGSFALECTIAHPIYELMTHGGFFSSLFRRPSYKDIVGDNPLAVGINTFDYLSTTIDAMDQKHIIFRSAPISPKGQSPQRILSSVSASFKSVPTLMRDHLHWSGPGGGLPLSRYLGSVSDGLRPAICKEWESFITKGGSVWDALMDATASFGLFVIPDYASTSLPVTPADPWNSSEIDIGEEDSYNLSFPGVDPSPIRGVAGVPETDGGFLSMLSTFSRTKSEKVGMSSGMLAFVPESGGTVNGVFSSVSLPAWILSAVQLSAAYAELGLDAYSDEPGTPPNSESGENNPIKDVNAASMQYLSYMFSIMFKKKLEAAVACPLMFSSGGATILPGKVASFVSGKKVLFRGMLVSVTHHVDVFSGYGSTMLHFGWCRPKDQYSVTSGYQDNPPLYS